jgi:uncharacterized membrane protein
MFIILALMEKCGPIDARLALGLALLCGAAGWVKISRAPGGAEARRAATPFGALLIPAFFLVDYLDGKGPGAAIEMGILTSSLFCFAALKFMVISPSAPSFESWLSRASLRLTLVFTIVYIGAAIAYNAVRYYHFGCLGHDLAIFIQSFWTALHGKLFWNTHEVYPGGSTFGNHFSPIMFLLLLFFGIWPSGITLLALKCVSLGLCAPVMYLLARDRLGGYAGLCFALCFLLYPGISYQVSNEYYLIFHAPLFLLLALHAFNRERFGFFCLFLILACSVREEVALTTFFWGFYAAIRGRSAAWVLFPAILSATWFAVSVGVIIPFFGLGQMETFYGDFGGSPGGIIAAALHNPALVLSKFVSRDMLTLVYLLLMPLGIVLPLGGAEIIFALPSLCVVALSSRAQMRSIYYYYYLPMIPFLFAGSVTALKNLSARSGIVSLRRHDAVVAVPTFLVFLSLAVFVRGPFAEIIADGFTTPRNVRSGPGYNETLWKAIRCIPPKGAVFCPRYMRPFLAQRMFASSVMPYLAEYLIVDARTEDKLTLWFQHTPFVRSLGKNPAYRLIFDENGVTVYVRKESTDYE